MEEDVRKIVLEIAAYILKLAGIGEDLEENRKRVMENIKNGLAYKKFLELVNIQGGNIEYLEDIPKAKYIEPVKSEKKGFVTELDAKKIGEVSVKIGAGRMKKDDEIDHLAGIVLNKKIGDKVEIGDILAYIHTNDESKIEEAKTNIKKAYEIESTKPSEYQHILNII